MTERVTPSGARHPAAVVLGAVAATGLDALLLAAGLGGMWPLLAHPIAIALLAVWGAGALVLGFLRPVRVSDPVAVRPDRAAMVALLLIPLATPAVAAFGER